MLKKIDLKFTNIAINIVLYYYLKHIIHEFMNIMSLLVYCLDPANAC